MDAELANCSTAENAISSHKADGPVESTVRNQHSTGSMVTIRLSDPVVPSDTDGSRPSSTVEVDALEEFPKMVDLNNSKAVESNSVLYEHQAPMQEEEATIAQSIHQESVTPSQREFTVTTLSAIEDGTSDTTTPMSIRSRSDSTGTFSSIGSAHVDWDELDRSEEQAPRDEGSDESTAFLLARLEQENNALVTDPKAAVSKNARGRAKTRPPSIQHLQKLVNEPVKPSLRYSLVQQPPPMTELEFWTALVVDYPQTAQRLPTLTSNKIRSGIPPPLRGVVWMSITGARERLLEDEYERLCGETSPYEGLIGKDIGRSFPNVEMFRDPAGEGQQMLAKVLKCFSLYDEKIGYCQGLGFVVGPLLMHMDDKEAFCVLVRLMEHYDLRSCFLPDLSGLHLRIYQFQQLLSRHLPRLTAHLECLQIEPLYVSQWFLSFFAVTCPLPMLIRIYDVILTEGASETLMRVALSLMRRNNDKILKCTEIEDVMQLLLSRELWDTYGSNADDLVNDFVGLTGLVTRDSLESLERNFRQGHTEDPASEAVAVPSVQAAASRFLGRFWSGSGTTGKVTSPGLTSPGANLAVSGSSRPSSFLRRTPSKQSMASTLNSIESSDSHLSAASTEATTMSRNPSDNILIKPMRVFSDCLPPSTVAKNKDKDLHSQIEDLLTALSDMQREQTILANELQKEREGREEDRAIIRRLVEKAQQTSPTDQPALSETDSDALTQQAPPAARVIDAPQLTSVETALLNEVADRLEIAKSKRASIVQTKLELQEDVKLWKYQYEVESVKSAELLRQLTDQEAENARLTEQFRDARTRVQETHQDKQRLEQVVQDLKARCSSMAELGSEGNDPSDVPESKLTVLSGLREFKLGRPSPHRSPQSSPTFAKRTSSLNMQAVLATEDHKPAAEEALLLELVNSKTSEAVARQELEEVKGKLDSLRKMLGVNTTPVTVSGHRPSPSEPCVAKSASMASSTSSRTPAQMGEKLTPPSSTTGGFFSGWGRRAPSNPAVPLASQ